MAAAVAVAAAVAAVERAAAQLAVAETVLVVVVAMESAVDAVELAATWGRADWARALLGTVERAQVERGAVEVVGRDLAVAALRGLVGREAAAAAKGLEMGVVATMAVLWGGWEGGVGAVEPMLDPMPAQQVVEGAPKPRWPRVHFVVAAERERFADFAHPPPRERIHRM